jgi:hypothetical protein
VSERSVTSPHGWHDDETSSALITKPRPQ